MPSKPKTKKFVAPLGDRVVPACDFDIMSGESIDPELDKQAPQEPQPEPKQDPLGYIMENYGEALKNRDVPGLLCGLIKEIVLLRMTK